MLAAKRNQRFDFWNLKLLRFRFILNEIPVNLLVVVITTYGSCRFDFTTVLIVFFISGRQFS